MSNIPCLIPYPHYLSQRGDNFFYFSKRNIEIDYPQYSEFIQMELIRLPEPDKTSSLCKIQVTFDDTLVSDEAYKLIITANNIKFVIKEKPGLFYALQTLKQLIRFNHNKLTWLTIEDFPAYEWRGLHLDVSRHFFTIDEIFSLLDRMAELKMNRFHWHLSDDQGWRVESKVYPKLTDISSSRLEEDGSYYSGYYTQKEINQVVAYASQKMIMVIPEIDLPGHTQAILAAYPELSCLNEEYEVWKEWGVSEKILCATNPKVYNFLENLLNEIIPLFPTPYFHIGGDECPTSQWEICPLCQKKVAQDKLSSFRELQSQITLHLNSILKKHNKRMIGWDEIADASAPQDAILMCWRGDAKQAVAKAKKEKRQYILTPNHPYYLDWKQSNNPDELGAFGVSTLSDIYKYNYANLDSSLMLGMQGNIWTERIETFTKLEYMAFPRIVALAENCWTSPKNKDYNRFLIYLKRYLSYYDDLYINYCTSNIDDNNKFIKQELITRDNIISDLPELTDVSSVFNPGAIKIDDVFYLLMRVQNRARETFLVKAVSKDGKEFILAQEPVVLLGLDKIKSEIFHIYDPRLTYLNNKIYVMTAIDTSTGCYLGLFTTDELETLTFVGIVSQADVRNGVIFPEKINNKFVRLERPNKSTLANGTKTGSAIYLSSSEDLITWTNLKFVMAGNPHYWDELIGSGPVPIKTRYGWLHIYHGVATHFASANIYQAGFTFLDLKDPSQVLFRSKYNFLEPRESYECLGQVPNVVFPTGLIALQYDSDGFVNDDSDLLLYYGCADTSIGLVETNLRFFIEKMLVEKE